MTEMLDKNPQKEGGAWQETGGMDASAEGRDRHMVRHGCWMLKVVPYNSTDS
jgi:hypothetical protein